MLSLQKLVFALFAILIITSCVSSNWQPTAIYHPETETVQTTTPVKNEFIVIMYSTDWCYWCKVAKKWMIKEKIQFVEKNYDDPNVKKKLKEYAKTIGYAGNLDSVPIFVIGTELMVGYNPNKILKAVGRKQINKNIDSSWETPLRKK